MPGEIVVGLDVGTTKVSTVVGEITAEGTTDIIGYSCVPCSGLRKGVVVDMESTAQAIRDSVEQAGQMAKVDIRSVLVGVTGEHIASQNSVGIAPVANQDQEITEEDRRRAVEESSTIVLPPDRRILHCIPRYYTVDGQQGVVRPVGMLGARLEVDSHIITAGRSFVENVLRCVYQAGLTLDGESEGVVYAGLAGAESVLSPDERQQGVMMVDLGGGTADLVIYHAGAIRHSAVIPVGGEHVTQDIAVGLRLAAAEATRVKCQDGHALAMDVDEETQISVTRIKEENPTLFPRKLLAEIIEPRVEELLTMICAEADRGAGDVRLSAGLVLTGGAAQLSGVVEMAHRMTEWPVRLGMPEIRGSLRSQLAAPTYSTAVGLVRLAAARRARPEDPGGRSDHLLGGLGRAFRRLFGRKPKSHKRRR
ncbi:MAG TPA: cell division protein FtsA [Armatimonadota bacterium]|jgi:cell division protein FtsA